MTIIGILTVIAMPSYQQALEQSQADAAAANLHAIWSAERLYWLDYQTYTTDLTQLQQIGPARSDNHRRSHHGYTYSVIVGEQQYFQAAATCAANTLSAAGSPSTKRA